MTDILTGDRRGDTDTQEEAKDLNRHIAQEDMSVADKVAKRCPTSLVIREMQIKTTT